MVTVAPTIICARICRNADIYVFDREVDCFDDCIPPDDRLILGDIAETLAAAATRFGGQVVLAHSDLGSYDEAHNVAMTAKLSRRLPAVLAPGAIVLSDLPLELSGTRALPLPAGVRDGRYFLYRNGPHAMDEIQPRRVSGTLVRR